MDAGQPLDLQAVLADLVDRKIERLMVEGGSAVHTQFLTAGVVDEIHLVIVVLAETRQIGDVVLLRYLPRH